MGEVTEAVSTGWAQPTGLAIGRAIILLVVGFVFARIAQSATNRLLVDRLSRHGTQIAKRVSFYGLLFIFVTMALRQLGFDLSVLLGAAGVLTVALGFASQTAASNLVSGLFLLIERPFEVGQVVRLGSTTGEVISIDWLSTTLRTFDNLAVRIPNESMMKSEITNFSRFPIRRYDLQVGIAYKEDLERVGNLLEQIASHNPLCLEEPKPLVIMQGFGDSSVDIQFSVWGLSSNYLDLRNSIQADIKEAFDREGIEIPFPHRTLYTGSVTDAFPVSVVSSEAASRDSAS